MVVGGDRGALPVLVGCEEAWPVELGLETDKLGTGVL